MYIYNKPHVDPDDAETGTTNNTEQASSSSHLHQLNSPPSPSAFPRRPSNISSTAKGAISNRPSKSRRHSLSFSLPPLFFQPPNSSSASLVPSTAEGKPIPLDDSTAAHRTSALRELNSTYPSPVNRHRHRYAKSSGAQSSTYSQPVIVRTYSGPSPSQASYSAHSYHHRPPSATRGGGSRRIPLPLPARAHSYLSGGRPAKPTISGAGSLGTGGGAPPSAGKHGQHVANMPRAHAKKSKLPWQWQLGSAQQQQQQQQGQQGHDEAKLPPLEAFSFKSFMADFQAEDGGAGGSIGADLDRIAEICARSRYSLSNQYEVHVAPHGSGSAFMSPGVSSSSSAAAGGRRRGNNGAHAAMGMGGPTLQAINSDDDDNNSNGNAGGRSHRKRRSGARRRSVAYGTLETIMSSSRSSEEEKAKKKKSAAEIADEVRGRAMRKGSDPPAAAAPLAEDSKSGSSGGTSGSVAAQPEGPGGRGLARKKSASFATAVMDSTRLQHTTPAVQRKKKKGATTMTTTTAAAITSSPRGSAATLVSEPALPQTSMGHLEIRTAPDDGSAEPRCPDAVVVGGLLPRPEDPRPSASGGGYVPGWSAWIPWRSGASGPNRRGGGGVGGGGASHAEGSLRQLLKTVDAKDKDKDKGKAVDREDRVGKSPEGL